MTQAQLNSLKAQVISDTLQMIRVGMSQRDIQSNIAYILEHAGYDLLKSLEIAEKVYEFCQQQLKKGSK